MGEFELIRRYFSASDLQIPRRDVCLGIGDDCALIAVPSGKQLAVSVDTSIAGVHFLPDASAHSIGWRALAVSLSDLAAMGAQPAWFTLALSLPQAEDAWLRGFAQGMAELSRRYGIALVGGDTTRSELLSISVQVQGYVRQGASWQRRGARAGDIIYVSDRLGKAALGLKLAYQQKQAGQIPGLDTSASPAEAELLRAYFYPEPRFDLIQILSSRVSSAIDISDGLMADLQHILSSSNVGARLDASRIPVVTDLPDTLDTSDAIEAALHGGDDYQICFTVSPQRRLELEVSAGQCGLTLYPIGVVERQRGIRGMKSDQTSGYDHFKAR